MKSYNRLIALLRTGVASAALLALTAGALTSCGGGDSYRANLDEIVTLQTDEVVKAHAMNPGISVYVDFSDGMNAAYGTEISREALRKVINVFTGTDNQASFYSLAADTIIQIDKKQTEIYNTIMSAANYTKSKAPIEKTLKEIVAKKQPALLITDFEEYNGSVIQQQNYAKSYFIDWLTAGYNIVFYKMDYKEGSKPKHLYFTVFDSADNALAGKINNALQDVFSQGVECFVLGGPDCVYGMRVNYPSANQGGNYHNSKGEDIVTGVAEDGGSESYISYPVAAAETRTDYVEIKPAYAPFTEYYPIGVEWEEVLSNAAALQEPGVEKGDRFAHLLSNVFVNFNVQSGYDIQGLEAVVYNFEPQITKVIEGKAAAEAEGKDFKMPKLESGEKVLDMFTASMAKVSDSKLPGEGWNEITVDFDSRYKGSPVKDLLKVDIVISKATPRLEGISDFFSWPGNNSLAESVRNTLLDEKVNPQGRVIIRYYLKSL